MNLNCKLKREACEYCSKTINIGQSIIECKKCSKIIHTKCFEISGFVPINCSYYCTLCFESIPRQYNPFKSHHSHITSDNDNFYNEELADALDTVNAASNILDNCKMYNLKDIDNLIANHEKVDFSTFFTNIDGNKSNFDSLVVELSNMNNQLSIIGLAETNIEPSLQHLFPITNYKSFYQNPMSGKKKGTGVALYIHQSFNATIMPEISQTSPNLESISLTVCKANKSINVICIYRPPNSTVTDFITEFKDIMLKLPKRPTYIMGDFNIDLLNDNDNSLIHEETFLSFSLFPLISISTHEQPNCKTTCIDNIFTNDIDSVSLTGTLQNKVSHHLPIFSLCKLNLNSESTEDTPLVQYYSYSKANLDKFVTQLHSNASAFIAQHIALDEPPNFTNFNNMFHENLDKTCKLSKPKTSKRNVVCNPWITDSISDAVKKKQELYALWNKTRNKKLPNGKRDLYDQYNEYRRCLKKIIKTAKSKYYCTKIENCTGDMKKTWQIINQIRGKNKISIKPQFFIDNKRIIERRVIANEFNKYFTSLASNLNKIYEHDSGVPISGIPKFTDFMPLRNPNSMYLQECSTDEVSKIISDLTNGKASDIPITVIKKASPIISPILAHIYNNHMSSGNFPDELKLGKISPVYKKEDRELLQNYRPVSTLPIFGKIFEKIIYCRLYSFLLSQNTLCSTQFGFRKDHSTSHALNYSINHIQSALNNNQHVLGIFIDLSKAFDTIDHSILLQKLEIYGIRGQQFNLLQSYLSNRHQYVNVLNEESEKLPVEFGVPQGSCLGPLLFLIYINDLCNATDACEFVLFADDTNIFVSAKDKHTAYAKATMILNNVHNYMKANRLHINASKCSHMYFSPDKRYNSDSDTDVITLTINNEIPVPNTKHTKFLGVIIDEKLSWSQHITQLTKKLACCTGILNRIKDNIPTHLHKDLYHTLFESHLAYGITVWGSVSQNKLFPLFRTQKSCLRILFGDKNNYLDKFKTCARARPFTGKGSQILDEDFYMKEHTKPLFNHMKLLTIHNLYSYHIITETFSILKSRKPISLFSFFNISNRKDTLLITPNPNLQYIHKASTTWNLARNILGNKCVDFSTKYGLVKTTIKTHLLKNQGLGTKFDWIHPNFEL